MMILLGLSLFPLGLTVAMFITRNMMLGFPSAIFWGVLGGYAYQQSSVTWDWQYTLFFAAMGMVIFSLFAAYTLRNKDLSGPDMDRGQFIDEGKHKERKQAPTKATEPTKNKEKKDGWGDIDELDMFAMEDVSASKHAQSLKERAKKRKEKIKWGEFK